MGPDKRVELIAAKKAELTSSLDAHIATLENLNTNTSFDFDIVSDIIPEIVEGSTEYGQRFKQFFVDLYQALEEGAPHIVIRQYNVALADGCYGMGAEAEYSINESYLRYYKNLRSENIVYTRGAEGKPQIYIQHPSYFAGYTSKEGLVKRRESNPALLAEPYDGRIDGYLGEGSAIMPPQVFWAKTNEELTEMMRSFSNVTLTDGRSFMLGGSTTSIVGSLDLMDYIEDSNKISA